VAYKKVDAVKYTCLPYVVDKTRQHSLSWGGSWLIAGTVVND